MVEIIDLDTEDIAEQGLMLSQVSKVIPEESEDGAFLAFARECRIGDLTKLLADSTKTINLAQVDDDFGFTALHYINFPSVEFMRGKGKHDARKRCAETLLKYRDGQFKEFLLSAQDSHGNTPLHIACEYKRFELVDVFLENGANGADPLVKRKCDGATPLMLLANGYNPAALGKIKLMIKKCGERITNQHLEEAFDISVQHSNSLEMLQYWIEEKQLSPSKPCNGVTPLQLACLAGNSEVAANCVKYILSKLDKNQINQGISNQRIKINPLHIAALTSNWRIMEVLVQNTHTDIKSSAPEGSVLHFIVLGYNGATPQAAVKCMELVIQRTNYWHPKEKEHLYFEITNKEKETVLDLACRLKAVDLITQLTEVVCIRDEPSPCLTQQRLSKIYRLCPMALVKNLDRCISFEVDMPNCIRLNLLYIVGKELTETETNNEQKKSEKVTKSTSLVDTQCLYELLKNHSDRDKILHHVSVKTYLDLKWKRTRYFAWIWTAIQVVFMVSYTALLLDIQKANGHSSPSLDTVDKVTDVPSILFSMELFIFTLILSLLFVLKEILQVANDWRSHIKSPANWSQLLFLILFLVSVISGFWKTENAISCQTVAGAFGAFLGWILLVRDIGKLPQCERQAEILAKVCTSSVKMILFYASCLIGALVAFRLLMKDNETFNLPFGFVKVFTMMIGDLAYDDLFDEQYKIQYEEVAKLFMLTFTFIVAIVLFNLLVALAVSDINELQITAEHDRRVGQVEFIYAFEKCLAQLQRCHWLKNVYSSICAKDGELINMKVLPLETYRDLRLLSEKISRESAHECSSC